jgi:hypothetical protein
LHYRKNLVFVFLKTLGLCPVAFFGIREMNSKEFWKPPGYGKSREICGKSSEISFPGNRQISGQCLKKSANFREIGKFLGFLGKSGKFLGNFWEESANF